MSGKEGRAEVVGGREKLGKRMKSLQPAWIWEGIEFN